MAAYAIQREIFKKSLTNAGETKPLQNYGSYASLSR